MSSRSLNVASQHIQKVKNALQRNGFRSQQALATEMGVSRDTVRKFVNGIDIDRNNFIDFCEKLGLDWQEIVDKPEGIEEDPNFVGREKAIAALTTLIAQRNAKAVNIYASGGVGKTTIAKQYLKVNGYEKVLELSTATDTEEITPAAFFVDEWLRNQFKQEPSQDFTISLHRLKAELKTQVESRNDLLICYLVNNQIDAALIIFQEVKPLLEKYTDKGEVYSEKLLEAIIYLRLNKIEKARELFETIKEETFQKLHTKRWAYLYHIAFANAGWSLLKDKLNNNETQEILDLFKEAIKQCGWAGVLKEAIIIMAEIRKSDPENRLQSIESYLIEEHQTAWKNRPYKD